MNDFCQGHQEAFPGEAAWTLDLQNSRNSLGREGGRAFQAERTACVRKGRELWKHLACSGIYGNQGVCVGTWGVGQGGPGCASRRRVGTESFQVGRGSGEGERSWCPCVVVPVPVASWGEQLGGAGDDLIFDKFPIRLRGASVSPSLNWGESEMPRLPGKVLLAVLILCPAGGGKTFPPASSERWSEAPR